MTFAELLIMHKEEGHRFQKQLGEFIVAHDCHVVVETGTGVSTLFILDAMDRMGSGKLYSIDTGPWFKYKIEHPRLEFIQAKSVDAMKDLYKQTGAWDLFLHDGNHDILAQTYEYEFAHCCVKENGFIASDDYTWGGHNAWEAFTNAHRYLPFKLGDIEIVRKSESTNMAIEFVDDMHNLYLSRAEDAEKRFLDSGGKNSDCFKD